MEVHYFCWLMFLCICRSFEYLLNILVIVPCSIVRRHVQIPALSLLINMFVKPHKPHDTSFFRSCFVSKSTVLWKNRLHSHDALPHVIGFFALLSCDLSRESSRLAVDESLRWLLTGCSSDCSPCLKYRRQTKNDIRRLSRWKTCFFPFSVSSLRFTQSGPHFVKQSWVTDNHRRVCSLT